MELVAVKPEYYDFVREMRTHPENSPGFIEQVEITREQQEQYMQRYAKNYYICLLYNEPVGYVGVIDNDIRICTHPDFKGVGIGSFMLDEIVKIFPGAIGKILKGNTASQRLFEKCKVPYTII